MYNVHILLHTEKIVLYINTIPSMFQVEELIIGALRFISSWKQVSLGT